MMNPMSMMNMMSQMMPPHGGHHGSHVVEGYFKKLADGPVESVPAEIKTVMLCVVKEYMDAVMARHGYMTEGVAAGEPCGYDKELHKAFKETIEEMRELNSSQVPAFIDDHFEGLSSGERRVLMAQASMPSKRKRAENINMSKEHFIELNHSAETKLKRK